MARGMGTDLSLSPWAPLLLKLLASPQRSFSLPIQLAVADLHMARCRHSSGPSSPALVPSRNASVGILPRLFDSCCLSSSCSCSVLRSKTSFRAPPRSAATFLTNLFHVQGLWKASPQPPGTARQFPGGLLSPSGGTGGKSPGMSACLLVNADVLGDVQPCVWALCLRNNQFQCWDRN